MVSSFALLVARLVVGLGLATHGSQKLFGWFGGSGPKGIGAYFATLGFPAPVAFAILAGIGEFAGGLLLAVGWLGPIGPALIITVMLVASLSEHLPHGFFNYNGGYELPAAYAMTALVLAFVGPGSLSIDALVPVAGLAHPEAAWIAIGAGLLIGLVVSAMRRAPHTSEKRA
ncbi:DoxX family protein [bacterium]|nr:MAG: DoxX family protein [bacterium]